MLCMGWPDAYDPLPRQAIVISERVVAAFERLYFTVESEASHLAAASLNAGNSQHRRHLLVMLLAVPTLAGVFLYFSRAAIRATRQARAAASARAETPPLAANILNVFKAATRSSESLPRLRDTTRQALLQKLASVPISTKAAPLWKPIEAELASIAQARQSALRPHIENQVAAQNLVNTLNDRLAENAAGLGQTARQLEEKTGERDQLKNEIPALNNELLNSADSPATREAAERVCGAWSSLLEIETRIADHNKQYAAALADLHGAYTERLPISTSVAPRFESS